MEDSRRDRPGRKDDALIRELSAVLAGLDPAPPSDAAEALLTWRSVDAELADLLDARRMSAPPRLA